MRSTRGLRVNRNEILTARGRKGERRYRPASDSPGAKVFLSVRKWGETYGGDRLVPQSPLSLSSRVRGRPAGAFLPYIGSPILQSFGPRVIVQFWSWYTHFPPAMTSVSYRLVSPRVLSAGRTELSPASTVDKRARVE